jgi:hypothetical protein
MGKKKAPELFQGLATAKKGICLLSRKSFSEKGKNGSPVSCDYMLKI